METAALAIHLTFTPEDLAWMQTNGVDVPAFWTGHPVSPALGDVLRLADRQFVVCGRAWEHNGLQPVLRLYLTDSKPHTDATLH